MNAKVQIYNRQRDLSAIGDLFDPHGTSAVIGQPVAPLILGIYEHYEEHARELEQTRW